MSLNTDFNVKPYFDDFNEDKNFHRVLFKPHLAVQARELTQLQTILQNQIERFGNNILREGTIITGGNFVEEDSLQYVKLQDLNAGETAKITVANYVGKYAVGKVTGLKALIVASEFGLESQDPNTIWVKYLNTTDLGSGDVKVFNNGEDIEIRTILDDPTTVIETTAAVLSAATGIGYGVRCGEGIIYQKGFFVKFHEQIAVVSKYTNKPDGVVVGFQTSESIVNSFQDTSLLDNANSFNNYNAPGADRLKLTPVLVVKTLAEAIADETFFALQEYQGGRLIRRKLDTIYSVLGDAMAKRRFEESGNYVVWGFDVGAEESSNTSNITLTVSPGVGYVNGYRVDLNATYKLDTPQGTEFITEYDQNVLINYGSYVIVNNMSGEFNFQNLDSVTLKSGNTTIGTAKVRSVTNENITAKTYRLYLFDIQMNSGKNFANTTKITNGTSTSDVVLTSGVAVVNDSGFDTLIYPVGKSHIKTFNAADTTYVYRTKKPEQITTGGVMQVSVTSTDLFPYGMNVTLNSDQKKDLIVVVTNNNGAAAPFTTGSVLDLTNVTVTTSADARTLSFQWPAGSRPSATVDVAAYYNVMRTNVSAVKKGFTDYTITLNTGTNSATNVGPWCLGMPDGYSLTSVTVNGVDMTSQFTLDNGQRDSYYGLSYLVNNGATIPAGATIVANVKAFTKVASTAMQSFFDSDSYTDVLSTSEIPVYLAESGNKYSLRDCIDFRPYATTTFTGTSATNPSSTVSFPSAEQFLAAPNSYVSITYDYYVGRYDKLIMDKNGTISVLMGQASANPVRPPNPSDGIVLGTFYIPPYPSLPSATANKLGMPYYAVRFTKQNNRRYTMADIRALDMRIQNLEYYTSLSLLENKTKDMVVLDANGLNRFKNGIFVDPFKDFRIADVNHKEFKAAINTFETVLEPHHKTFVLDLKVTSTVGATDFGDVISLNKTDYAIIDQPYATAQKNLTTGFYNYNGQMYLIPDDDTAPDITTVPDINIDIDLATPFIEYTDALWDVLGIQSAPVDTRRDEKSPSTTTSALASFSSSSSTSSSSSGTNGNGQTTRTTTTTTTSNTLGINAHTNVVNVGDYVKDITIDPYLRAREVKVYVSGLRPNTTVYPYFDGVSVSQYCAPAKLGNAAILNGTYNTATLSNNIVASGPVNTALTTNANGELFAIFHIPVSKFKVGDRLFEVFDVSSYNSKDASTTYSSKMYTGYNFSLSKSSLTVSTRLPDFTTTTRTSVRRSTSTDPLVQSFIIDPEAADEAYSFITGVDVYFATKDAITGVTVGIKEFENGNPVGGILPHSIAHLDSSQVSTSTNGTVPTRFAFNAPIPLKTNTEYGIWIMPDRTSPDYKVYISRTGETDIATGIAITQDTNSGTLFTSTNDRTWTPYQNENLKYKLYAAEFTSSTGIVTLEPRGQEFLVLSGLSGSFTLGEKIFIDNSSSTLYTGTVSFSQGNNSITGVGSNFSGVLESGDWVCAYEATNGYQLLQVSQNGVNSTTSITVDNYPTIDSVAGTTWFETVIGEVSSIITKDGITKLVIRNSSAKLGALFATGKTIRGYTSGASATISSLVDQQVSFIQPNIRRLDFIETRTSMIGKMSLGATTKDFNVVFDDTTYFNDNNYLIPSYSNVLNGTKPTTFEVKLENVSLNTKKLASPILDHSISTILGYEYIVSDDYTDETTTNGKALSKYVSKLVTLAEGMDAEDMKLFLTAYRPFGTNIKVYGKFISISDGRNPNNIGWTEMVLRSEFDFYSSSTNRYDFKEFEFGLPTIRSTNADTASYSDVTLPTGFYYKDTAGVTYSDYKFFAIKIVLLSNSYARAPRVDDVRLISLI